MNGPVDARAPCVVLLVERSMAVRETLLEWLQQEFPRCRHLAAETPAAASRLAQELRPTVALINVDLPDSAGFDALRRLRVAVPDTRLVALSMFNADAFEAYALGAGAVACLPMSMGDARLRDLLERLLAAAPKAK